MKNSEVSIKTRSPPASFSFKGQATKHTTVKWAIGLCSNFVFWLFLMLLIICRPTLLFKASPSFAGYKY